MDWLDEIEARGYTNDLTPNDVYLLLAEVRRLREALATAEKSICDAETYLDLGSGKCATKSSACG